MVKGLPIEAVRQAGRLRAVRLGQNRWICLAYLMLDEPTVIHNARGQPREWRKLDTLIKDVALEEAQAILEVDPREWIQPGLEF